MVISIIKQLVIIPFFILLMGYSSFGFATFGSVIRVLDGDTLIYQGSRERAIKVRLAEIDAPENNQSMGNQSAQALQSLCLGVKVTLDIKGKDRYGRTLAHVYCDNVNANLKLVNDGMGV